MLPPVSALDSQSQQPAFEKDYTGEAVRLLRSSDPAERAAAAQTLGILGDPLSTAHLIAVLFDEAPEVSRAAAEALIQIGDPDVAIPSLNTLFGLGYDQPVSKEDEAAPPTKAQGDSLWIEAEAEHDDPRLAGAVGDVDVPGSGDAEEVLLPIERALRNLPPLTVAALHSPDPHKRISALFEVASSGEQESCCVIMGFFDDSSPDVRNAAARALQELEPSKAPELFDRALEDASPERCRNIGDAMIDSGLAAEAISDLSGEDLERGYNALRLLYVMAKISAVQPLVQAIEEHESIRVRSAAVRLLNLSGRAEIADAAVRRRLRI